MNHFMISVIVPVYNVADHLENCIKSIQEQTFTNIEIILIDDGSTDESGLICDRYAEHDNRIKVIHKKNGGLSDARNTGIEIARGEWYSFVDSDDYIQKDTLSKLYFAAKQNNCQIAVCNIVRVYENGQKRPFYNPSNVQVRLEADKRFETLQQPSVCNKLFSAKLFEGVRFPKGKYYEDTFVYHLLAHRADNIVLTGHDGYFYLSRQNSILNQSRYSERYFDFVEAIYVRTRYLLEHGIRQYAVEACLSLYAAVFTAERNIPKTMQNRDKFRQMRKWYVIAYNNLKTDKNISVKQKIRLVLLRYIPCVHNVIY